MKIELKNIKVYAGLSEETTAFVADVWADGQKIAHAENTGKGGCTTYHAVSMEAKEKVKQAEQYCAALPVDKWEHNGQTYEMDQSLESIIDDLLDQFLNAKEAAKAKKMLEKKFEIAICYTQNIAEGFSFTSFGKPAIPIAKLLASEKGKEAIRKVIEKKTAEGFTILNTNI